MNTKKPLVSICTLTYNHAPYLRECLDSLLMQKTNFAFEILINDDKSTDETQDIIKEYQAKYPKIIKPLFQEENQYSQGKRGMDALFVFPRAKGKYLAICEGDDYWTDELKLQKQVDFLEQNPDYTICFHDVNILNNGKFRKRNIPRGRRKNFTIEKLLKGSFIANVSVMYRNVVKEYPEWYFECAFTDYPTHLLHAMQGKIHRITETMAVYREGVGVFSSLAKAEALKQEIEVYTKIIKHLNNKRWIRIMSITIYRRIMRHYDLIIPNFKTNVKWRNVTKFF